MSLTLNRSRLCLVGGGASAVCVLDALAQSEVSPRALTVFEPAGDPWRGRPFQRDLESVRVNAPPAEMSIRAGDPHHFARWLSAHRLPASSRLDDVYETTECSYVSRSRYGEYLADAAAQAIGRLSTAGWDVYVVPEKVVDQHPLRLQLGADCVTRVEGKYRGLLNDLEQWRELSVSTSYDQDSANAVPGYW